MQKKKQKTRKREKQPTIKRRKSKILSVVVFSTVFVLACLLAACLRSLKHLCLHGIYYFSHALVRLREISGVFRGCSCKVGRGACECDRRAGRGDGIIRFESQPSAPCFLRTAGFVFSLNWCALGGAWLWLVRKKKRGDLLAFSFLLLLLDLDVLAEPGETFEDAWSNWSAPLLLACVVFFF